MPFNGSGGYTLPYNWIADAMAGIDILASRMEAQDSDMAVNGFEYCLTRDGQGSPVSNLPMNGWIHTDVGLATARNQYDTVGQLQDGSIIFCNSNAGSAGAWTLTPVPSIPNYVSGQVFRWVASADAVGSDTINISGLGAINLYKIIGSGVAVLAAVDFKAGQTLEGIYNAALNSSAGGLQLTTPLASSGGNVTGPASSTANDIPKFADTSGKVLSDGYTVGTSANNLLQLNGSAQIPAVSGALLTNLPFAVTGNATGLKIINDSGTPNTKIDVTAVVAIMATTSGLGVYASGVSVVIDCTTTGANGLDTGALGASTWYAIYLINNGSTTSGLASLSSTSPTMPAGYTYKVFIGWMRTDSSSNFMRTLQRGRTSQYVVTATTNTANLPIIAPSGSAGNVSTPTWAALAVGGFVPPTAGKIRIVVSTTTAGNATIVAPNNSYGAINSTSNPPPIQSFIPTSGASALTGELTLESTNIYWASSGAGLIAVLGWEDYAMIA